MAQTSSSSSFFGTCQGAQSCTQACTIDETRPCTFEELRSVPYDHCDSAPLKTDHAEEVFPGPPTQRRRQPLSNDHHDNAPLKSGDSHEVFPAPPGQRSSSSSSAKPRFVHKSREGCAGPALDRLEKCMDSPRDLDKNEVTEDVLRELQSDPPERQDWVESSISIRTEIRRRRISSFTFDKNDAAEDKNGSRRGGYRMEEPSPEPCTSDEEAISQHFRESLKSFPDVNLPVFKSEGKKQDDDNHVTRALEQRFSQFLKLASEPALNQPPAGNVNQEHRVVHSSSAAQQHQPEQAPPVNDLPRLAQEEEKDHEAPELGGRSKDAADVSGEKKDSKERNSGERKNNKAEVEERVSERSTSFQSTYSLESQSHIFSKHTSAWMRGSLLKQLRSKIGNREEPH